MASVCLSVCPSVTLVDCDHISNWNSWKIISRLISVGFLLSVSPNIMDLLRMEHFQNGTNPWFLEHILRPNLWFVFNVIWVWFSRRCCLFIIMVATDKPPRQNFYNSPFAYCSQGVQQIFTAPVYRAHCAVIFAIAQLSCITYILVKFFVVYLFATVYRWIKFCVYRDQ